MKEDKIIILEKYLSGSLSQDEKNRFDELIQSDPNFKIEVEEQQNIREVLKKMTLKNPSKEIWDNYWTVTYNKIERSLGWIIFLIGAIIVGGYAIGEAVEKFIANDAMPALLKYGVGAVVIGAVILVISIFREKITLWSKDKYKEIQR
ncbi:MAG: hypothetical protein K9J16_04895 [Melioribacteraceae bacterium]|nr:hypothetical protein [Melioribacteraceae bacterium]MCF8355783.1 hypothetical protein [Melioribacteraceae bacterium]MCF8392827.1 hypothetical protein [Melioribacteraceae bacterium]MCF8418687.1 hypothetical protein [Melioribacteraceae bacterium]